MVQTIHVENENTAQQFNNMIGGKHTMVLYYMTGCGYCEMMKPDWLEFEEEAKRLPFNVIVARVNSSYMDSINADKDVMGFPTIFYLFNGKKQGEFNKSRSKEEFHNFLKDISVKSKSKMPSKSEKKTTFTTLRNTPIRSLEQSSSFLNDLLPILETKSLTDEILTKKSTKKSTKKTSKRNKKSSKKSIKKTTKTQSKSNKKSTKKTSKRTKKSTKTNPFTTDFSI